MYIASKGIKLNIMIILFNLNKRHSLIFVLFFMLYGRNFCSEISNYKLNAQRAITNDFNTIDEENRNLYNLMIDDNTPRHLFAPSAPFLSNEDIEIDASAPYISLNDIEEMENNFSILWKGSEFNKNWSKTALNGVNYQEQNLSVVSEYNPLYFTKLMKNYVLTLAAFCPVIHSQDHWTEIKEKLSLFDKLRNNLSKKRKILKPLITSEQVKNYLNDQEQYNNYVKDVEQILKYLAIVVRSTKIAYYTKHSEDLSKITLSAAFQGMKFISDYQKTITLIDELISNLHTLDQKKYFEFFLYHTYAEKLVCTLLSTSIAEQTQSIGELCSSINLIEDMKQKYRDNTIQKMSVTAHLAKIYVSAGDYRYNIYNAETNGLSIQEIIEYKNTTKKNPHDSQIDIVQKIIKNREENNKKYFNLMLIDQNNTWENFINYVDPSQVPLEVRKSFSLFESLRNLFFQCMSILWLARKITP